MKNVFLGEYIKQRRLDLGLTQEQLCDGICEPMTLSRLENGKQTPSRNRINALLQRLGLPDDRYFALLSKNELEMEALQKEIVACNANHRVEEGFETLKKFEQIADHDDQIAQQFILCWRHWASVRWKVLPPCVPLYRRAGSCSRTGKIMNFIRSITRFSGISIWKIGTGCTECKNKEKTVPWSLILISIRHCLHRSVRIRSAFAVAAMP